MTVSHTKAKFENFPSSGIKRVPGAKNMRKNRRKQVDERNLLCYNHQCRRICGCSSMARIPAFQAGRVGSIPITRSKRKVAVKRLFCFLKIRESNLRFALLRFPLLPRCRLQLPTAALRFARCIIRRMRSQPRPSPAPKVLIRRNGDFRL